MTTFVLVHGTFVSRANWPALSEALVQVTQAAGDNPQFKELAWTGKNSIRARQIAAASIADLIQSIRTKSKGEKIFIIAHSHGGSAVAYFIKYYPDIVASISGYIFLSTPFIAIRPREHAVAITSTLLLFLATVITQFVARIFPEHGEMIDVFGLLIDKWWWGIGWTIILPGLFFGAAVLLLRRARDTIASAIRNQTADLPALNYLFLRFSGDEAASALSAAQFSGWAGMRVAQIFEKLMFPKYRWRFAARNQFTLLFCCSILAAHGAHLHLVPLIKEVGLGHVVYAILHSVADGTLAGFFVGLSFLLFALVPILVLFLFLLASGVFILHAITLWAFGWTGFIHGFVVEMAVEPLPFGNHSLENIDWTSGVAAGLRGIVHSWTYAHPLAIRQIQEWVRENLSAARKI